MAMNTRGEALLNAYLNRYINAQKSTVNSGQSDVSGAAKSGIQNMNALDIDIPALPDYTDKIYSGIIENGKKQMDAYAAAQKAAEEAAQKAAEAAAKQSARNNARRSSGSSRNKTTTSASGSSKKSESNYNLSDLLGDLSASKSSQKQPSAFLQSAAKSNPQVAKRLREKGYDVSENLPETKSTKSTSAKSNTESNAKDEKNVIEEAWNRAEKNTEGIRKSILSPFVTAAEAVGAWFNDTFIHPNLLPDPDSLIGVSFGPIESPKTFREGTKLTEKNSLGVRLANEAQEDYDDALEGLDPASKFVAQTANSLVASAPGYALSAIPGVGPALGSAYIGVQAGGNKISELSNEGVDAREALGRGIISGGIEMATEKVPVENWVRILNSQGSKSVVRNLLTQMGSEAAEEAESYIANYAADVAARDPNAEFSLSELAQNALGGALGGGIMGGIGYGAGTLAGNYNSDSKVVSPTNNAPEIQPQQNQMQPYAIDEEPIDFSDVPELFESGPTQWTDVNGGLLNGTEANPDLGGNVPANFETGNPGGAGQEYQPAGAGGTAVAENGGEGTSAAPETAEVNYASIAQQVTGRDRRSPYTRRLQSLYENIANGAAQNVDSEIDDIARGLVRESDYTIDSDPAEQTLRDYLKNTRIYVNPSDVSEILNATGLKSISQYNIQNGLNLTTKQENAIPLDTALQEISDMNVGYAGDGTSPVDDLMQIAPRPGRVVDSDLMQANIDYTKELILDNFSGQNVPTFEDWLAENNVSNEWGDAPDYIQRVADRYGIEHRVENNDDFGVDDLPESDSQPVSANQETVPLWNGESGSIPERSIGADIARDYNRAVVPNLDPGTQRSASLYLAPEDMTELGLGDQTHQVYSFREAADTARSDVDVAVQQNSGDELSAIDQMSQELADKMQWDVDDVSTAQELEKRLQNQLSLSEPGSPEYQAIHERLKLLYERHSAANSRNARALVQNRAAEFTEFTPFQKFQQAADRIARSWENSHRRESENLRGLARDISDAAENIPGPQDAEFDEFIRSQGVEPSSDQAADQLNATENIVRNMANQRNVNLNDAQVRNTAQRVIAGGDENEVFNRLVSQIAGVEELDGQDFEDVVAIADRIKDMPDSQERYRLEEEMYSIMGRLLPARSWFERLNNIRYLAMLGNPRTHVRNITGNILMRGLTGMSESISAAIQKALPQDQRTRAILTPGDSELVRAARNYAYNQAYSRVFRNRDTIYNFDGTSQTVGDRFNIRFGIERARNTYGNSRAGRILEGLSNANSDFMTSVDDWFRASEFSKSLAQQLKAQGLGADALADPEMAGRVDLMVERAIADANEATFQSENWLSTWLSQSSNNLRNGTLSQRLLYMLEEGVLPFKRTPTNIAKTALEYNPLGATVEAIYRASRGRSAADVIDSASKGITGTALIAAGFLLANAGLLNGSGSDDDSENGFNEMQGQQPYSINIPGVGSYTIDWASPAAVPLLLGAELPKVMNGNYNAGQAVDALRNMGQPVLEMTMLSGLNDTLDNLRYLDDNQSPLEAVLSNAASNYFGQFTPTLLGQIARTVDDTRRDTYGGGESRSQRDLNYNIRSFKNKIPGLSETNEPWIDAWGREQENVGDNPLERAFYNMISPGYFSGENTTPVDNYLDDLYDATGESGILPSRAGNYVKVDGQNVYLTPEQKTDYATTRGQTAYNIIDELIGNSTFNGLSDSEKAEAIKDVYSLANKVGAAAALPDYSADDPLYDVYLNSGVDGVVDYSLATAATANALAEKKASTGNESASLSNSESWDAMQSIGLDDEALVDTYLSKNTSDSVASRINDSVGAEGVIAYRDAYSDADTDGNGKVSDSELRMALINGGLDDDLMFKTYMAATTTDSGTDEKAASAYSQFGTSGGADWMRYYTAYSLAKEQEQARAKANGETANLKGLATDLLNQMDISADERRAFFALTNSGWKNNPF